MTGDNDQGVVDFGDPRAFSDPGVSVGGRVHTLFGTRFAESTRASVRVNPSEYCTQRAWQWLTNCRVAAGSLRVHLDHNAFGACAADSATGRDTVGADVTGPNMPGWATPQLP